MGGRFLFMEKYPRLHKDLVATVRADASLGESIILETNHLNFTPPFILRTSSPDLEQAHARLIESMGKFGYRSGRIYRQ